MGATNTVCMSEAINDYTLSSDLHNSNQSISILATDMINPTTDQLYQYFFDIAVFLKRDSDSSMDQGIFGRTPRAFHFAVVLRMLAWRHEHNHIGHGGHVDTRGVVESHCKELDC